MQDSTGLAVARYYTRRAEQERAVAARTDNPAARRVHVELAELYAALGSGAQAG